MSSPALSSIALAAAAAATACSLGMRLEAQSAQHKMLFPAPYYGKLYTSAPGLSAVVPGECNGDGQLDVIGSMASAQGIGVALGNGDATFGGTILTSLAISPYWLEAADLDADGISDLVTNNGSKVGATLGAGDGTFGPFLNATAPVNIGFSRAGDMNGDGTPDLVSASFLPSFTYPNQVSVLLGAGDGSFSYSVSMPAGISVERLALSDLNGDGYLDLATTNGQSTTGAVHVLMGLANGGLLPTASYAVSSTPEGITAADVDGDGDPELAVSSQYSGPLTVLWNVGGTFAGSASSEIDAEGSHHLASFDPDSDGRAELLVGTYAHTLAIVEGDGIGGLTKPIYFAGSGSGAARTADFDGNGLTDVLTEGFGLLLGSDSMVTGGLEGPVAIRLAHGNSGVYTTGPAFPGDYDGDGVLDFAGTAGGRFHVLLGNGDGTFDTTHPVDLGGPIVAHGDLNQDGIADFAARSGSSVKPLLGLGNGQFTLGAAAPAGGLVQRGISGDMNGDGKLDVVVPAKGSLAINLLLGNGDGTLQPASIHGAGVYYEVAVAGDLDSDGDLDVAAVENKQFTGLYVLLGDGAGALAPPHVVALPWATDLVPLDYDQDGKLDLAVSAAQEWMLFGDGAGGFAAQVPLVSSSGAVSLEFADFDGDGKLDLAGSTGSYYEPDTTSTAVWMGTGSLPFSEPVYFNGGGVPRAGDFDADGRLDLVQIHSQNNVYAHVKLNRIKAPLITAVDGLPAATAGQAIVHGSDFDFATQVLVGGAPVPASPLGPNQLAVSLGSSAPGEFDLEVIGTFGSVLLAGGLRRYPDLSAGAAAVGQPLALLLENDGAGVFALAVSGGLLSSSITLPGIHYGIWLGQPLLLKVGAIAPGQSSVAHSIGVPVDPSLQGQTFYFQGWAAQATSGLSSPASFTDHERVVVQ